MTRALILLALALACPAAAGAATLALTERQQEEAIQAGERSVTADVLLLGLFLELVNVRECLPRAEIEQLDDGVGLGFVRCSALAANHT